MTRLPATTRKLQLTFWAGSHVGFALRRALNAALAEGLIPPLQSKIDDEVTERLRALHTKRACLPILVQRVRQSWDRVRDAARARDPELDEFTLDIGRSGVWPLVADIESLLTALHSTLDIAVGLVKVVERRVLTLAPRDRTPDAQLETLPGVSEEEQKLFRKVRGDFVHNYAAWLAVVLDGDSGADLAILTFRTPNYETGESYVLLSRIDAMLQALVRHIDVLEDSLADRINTFRG